MFGSKSQNLDRSPAVAGQFYPSNSAELQRVINELFNEAKSKTVKNTRAIITPHAGYIFSGKVAASAFNQIDADKKYDNIFLIGTSHHTYLKGASIYSQGDCIMPFGKIKINTKLAQELIDKYDFFSFEPNAHLYEHSIEVQLPFLYYKLNDKNFQIVPIIIGTNNVTTIQKIAQALKPYFNSKNLFIISTDFSHYPPYEDAKVIDSTTASAIISKNPENFLHTIQQNKSKGIPNLATSICGWSSVLTLMHLAQDNDSLTFEIIDYQNSGDSQWGEKDRVVGYYAIALTQKTNHKQQDTMQTSNSKFSLTDQEKKQLLYIARSTLQSYIEKGIIPEFDENKISQNLKTQAGAFVTLKNNGKLRGCIGRFMPSEPLWMVVREMTIAAATDDPRFSPVKPNELQNIEIEISVLTPLTKIDSPDEIIVGKHGIYCKYGIQSGTLLPQVATEQGWNAMEFVQYCCKYKANLSKDCYKYAELYVYEAIIFDESEL